MAVSGKLHVHLALGMTSDFDGEISGAYKVATNNTRKVHSLIMTLKRTSYTEEILKGEYANTKAELNKTDGILNKIVQNKDATHIVTYIEYGSQLDIECFYEGQCSIYFQFCSFFPEE